MSELEAKLSALGYVLSPAYKFSKPNRTGCLVVDKIVYVSGLGPDLPKWPGVRHQGKVPTEVSLEEAYFTARVVGLSILASLKQVLGDFDRLKRVIRLFGMVKVAPGFTQMPKVIDGASDLFFELLGDPNGKHARTAIGVAELPNAIPVEINGKFEIFA